MFTKLITFLIPAFLFAFDDIQITGKIINSETGDPIEMVNVFLANTMKGCVTDRDGRFIIKDVSSGIYDLIAHHIGFEGANIKVDMLNHSPEMRIIKLKPRILEGQKVQVEVESPKEWIKMLKVFKREFLGQSDNSRNCVILHPEFLNFQYEKSSGIFSTSTDSLLKIQNNSLGYLIELFLEKFEYQKSVVIYSIIPHFIELKPMNASEQEKWLKARQKTYLGSFRHFLSSLATNHLEDDYFKLSEMKQNYYKDDITPDLIIEPLPELQDHDHHFRKIHFNDCLKVSSPYFSDEHAFVCMKKEEALIDTKGNVLTEFAFYKSGYWSKERVADLLPNEYPIRVE
jgi:hypothetical protein